MRLARNCIVRTVANSYPFEKRPAAHQLSIGKTHMLRPNTFTGPPPNRHCTGRWATSLPTSVGKHHERLVSWQRIRETRYVLCRRYPLWEEWVRQRPPNSLPKDIETNLHICNHKKFEHHSVEDSRCEAAINQVSSARAKCVRTGRTTTVH